MYLVDTNAISELRKGGKADPGVSAFLKAREDELFLPAQVIGELNFGIERLKRKGDLSQVKRLQQWLVSVLETFEGRVLSFDLACGLIWGRLRSGSDQNLIDKQIAAIALMYDLTIVTRNTGHYDGTGVRVVNPFFAGHSSGSPVN
jgi:toxin FitB